MAVPFIGRSVPRREGRAKVTGQARYVDDFALPGMLFGATVRSDVAARPHPRHRFRSRDSLGRVHHRDGGGHSRAKPRRPHPRRSALPRRRRRQPSGGAGRAARAPRSAAASRRPGVTSRSDVEPLSRRVFSIDDALAGTRRGLGRGQHLQVVHGGARRRGRGVRRRAARRRRGRIRDRRAGAALHRAERDGRGGGSGRRASRCGARCSARTTSTTRWRRCSACRRTKSASCRWRPAAGSAARRSIRRSSPGTRRCSPGSRAGR